jgi:hypothetical protein
MTLFKMAFQQSFNTHRFQIDQVKRLREEALNLGDDKRVSKIKMCIDTASNLLCDITNDKGTLESYIARYEDVFPEGTIEKMSALIEELEAFQQLCFRDLGEDAPASQDTWSPA